MTPIHISHIILGALVIFSPFAAVAQTGPGDCHPYPGAVAQDCLELIGNHLRSQDVIECGSNGRATITLRNCSITTKCAAGTTDISADDAVRRALTTIGKCALSDYGSISGNYVAEDGSKTCYLYPSQENNC